MTGEPIKQSMLIQRLEINFSEETKEFLLKALQAEAEWIPCSERLPNEERHYLCCYKGYLPFIAHYHDGQWHCIDGTTHAHAWMPLPEPYKGGDTE